MNQNQYAIGDFVTYAGKYIYQVEGLLNLYEDIATKHGGAIIEGREKKWQKKGQLLDRPALALRKVAGQIGRPHKGKELEYTDSRNCKLADDTINYIINDYQKKINVLKKYQNQIKL